MRTALIVAALTGAAQPLGAQVARLDTIIPALMKEHEVPGMAVAIVRGDSVIYLRGFGVARVNDSTRVDPERTVFRLASVAKLFVATAVMQQVEAGNVRTDEDVNRYLAWRIPATWPQPITLEHLLTHTAGFDERMIGYGAPSAGAVGDLGEHLRSNLPHRGWPPGAVIGYSNYGMALAAHVVERTSGMPFDRYARERIFRPLGMARTSYITVPDSLLPDLAVGYRCRGECTARPTVYSRPYPVGLAYSTAADMARFLSAQLRGERILSMAARKEMQRSHFAADSATDGMSYAWFNQRHRDWPVLAHGGNVPGFNNLLLVVPGADLGVYFVTNGGYTVVGTIMRDTLLSLLLPPRAVAARAPPAALGAEYVKSLAGPYQMARYAHRTIEKLPALFATSVTVDVKGARLVLPYPDGALEFEPVDSLHFREVNGERLIAFRRDASGRVTHLAAPVPVFGAELPMVLERRAWHDGASFMNEYLSWLLMGPVIVLALWGLVAVGAWWWRKRKALPQREAKGRGPGLAVASAVAFAGLWIWFGFGFIAKSVRMMGDGTGLVQGVSSGMRAMAAIPFLMAAIAVLLAILLTLAWRRRWWDVARRSLMTVFVVGAIATIAFLIRWNYLPAVFQL